MSSRAGFEDCFLTSKVCSEFFKESFPHNHSSLLSLQINTFFLFFVVACVVKRKDWKNFLCFFMNQIKVSPLAAQGEKLIFCVNRACSSSPGQFFFSSDFPLHWAILFVIPFYLLSSLHWKSLIRKSVFHLICPQQEDAEETSSEEDEGGEYNHKTCQ